MSVGGEDEREGGMLKYRRIRLLRWSSFTLVASDEGGGGVDDDIEIYFLGLWENYSGSCTLGLRPYLAWVV